MKTMYEGARPRQPHPGADAPATVAADTAKD